jgi:hypothetical protein
MWVASFSSKVFQPPDRYQSQVDTAMYISDSQMQNVLKVYTSQLSKKKASGHSRKESGKSVTDTIRLPTEGRRQSVIKKVAEDIVARITRGKSRRKTDGQDFIEKLREKLNQKLDREKPDTKRFVYNVIGDNKEKKTNILSTEDTRFLMRRLEELANSENAKPGTE